MLYEVITPEGAHLGAAADLVGAPGRGREAVHVLGHHGDVEEAVLEERRVQGP